MHVSIKCHRFINHLLVNAAGVEQMQSVFVPGGNTDVGCVETLFVGNDGDNVTIVNSVAENCRVGNLAFRNITIPSRSFASIQIVK